MSLVIKGFKFELDPNQEQRISLAQHVGAARYAYNWGLAICREALERGEPIPSAKELHKQWNVYKREHAPWWTEVSKCAPQEALRDLERAFRNWRAGRSGFPRFKRKKNLADNKARFNEGKKIGVTPRHVKLPRIGKVRLKERATRLVDLIGQKKARILSATISREADRWFVSLTVVVEQETPEPLPKDAPVVGIDLGLATYATLYDGRFVGSIEIPEAIQKKLTKLEKKIRREQRRLSRKRKTEEDDPNHPGRKRRKLSRNGLKNLIRLQRLYRRRRNVLHDFLHKTTTRLAKAKQVYVVENLNIKALMRRRKNGYRLSGSIANAAWGELLRQLKYKSGWYGSRVIEAPMHYPSSRMCSACGAIHNDLKLSHRVFRCPQCGWTINRDVNAALNPSPRPSPIGGGEGGGVWVGHPQRPYRQFGGKSRLWRSLWRRNGPQGPVYEPRVVEAGRMKSSLK